MTTKNDALLTQLARFGADVVLINGNVVTMDPARPRAEAAAVKAGRIVAVGTAAEVMQAAVAATRVIDLAGRTLLPGFVDSHSHMSAWSHTIRQVDGSNAANRNIAEILEKVGTRAASQPRGTWIEGYGYDHTTLEKKRHLTRWDLDEVAPDHPVHFWHVSGHFTAVNTMALELAGITAETADPPSGMIYRDDNGEPNGLLGETGIQVPVLHLIPPKPVEERARGLGLVNQEYVKAGVTSVHDANLGVFGGLGGDPRKRRACNRCSDHCVRGRPGIQPAARHPTPHRASVPCHRGPSRSDGSRRHRHQLLQRPDLRVGRPPP